MRHGAPEVPRVVEASDAAVADAADVLRRGGLVAFPTETVYGLGGAARNPDAVRAIFRAKGRPSDHPLIVHVAEVGWLDRWARDIPPSARVLADVFWPGPLTMILRRAPRVPDAVTGGAETVGVRMPAHPVALALIERVGDALAAPSANRFGRISPTRAEHVVADLGGTIDLILDGGPCRVGVESTIIDLSTGVPRLLRPGGIAVEEVERVLGQPVAAGTADAPPAPGSLPSHYAPGAPAEALPRAELEREAGPADAVLAFGPPPPRIEGAWHVLSAEPEAAAREFYAALRALDAAMPSRILIELPPATPPWRAVRDRILRAAAAR